MSRFPGTIAAAALLTALTALSACDDPELAARDARPGLPVRSVASGRSASVHA